MLRFDPQGADFSAWVNHMKGEVYDNWSTESGLEAGETAKVRLEFVVDRGGRVTSVHVAQSSGDARLDEAAGAALGSARTPPLPSAFPDETIQMSLTFLYVGDVAS